MLNQKDKQILKIKSAMWESCNEDRLLSKAIRAYKDPQADEAPKESLNIIVNGKEVVVRNVPHLQSSDEIYENLFLSATLEEIVSQLYQDETPEVIDFEELVK